MPKTLWAFIYLILIFHSTESTSRKLKEILNHKNILSDCGDNKSDGKSRFIKYIK